MAVIKCKMCGGNLSVVEGQTVCECEYCGTKQTVPSADSEKKLTLFSRASRLLRSCEFDKASGVFESIVADFPEDAEAYWGLVLCKYGIEYVDDPATGKKIPTCHRSSFDSVLDDPNYEQACENTDAVARRVYRDEARQIEELRQAILQVSGKEEPYDIFISYKETDANGERTLDSVIAQDIYKELTNEGYRVFFSRISLEKRLGTEYEPYIFAALNSAKVMIVVGTDYENFDAVWVKNEWSRFLKLIAAGQKKTLIPVFKDMDPYDMPKEFAKLQAQDMGKIGAMQDLLHGVEKLISKKSTGTPAVLQPVYAGNEADAKTTSSVKRGMLALEESSWEKAKQYFENALSFDAECAEAYLGIALSSVQCRSIEEYIEKITSQAPEQKSLSISAQTEHIRDVVKAHIIPHFLEESEIQKQYQNFNLTYTSTVDGCKKILDKEKLSFDNNRMFSLAFRFAKGDFLKTLQSFKRNLFCSLEKNVQVAQEEEHTAFEKKTEQYKSFIEWADKKVEDLFQKKQAEREAEYQQACKLFTEAGTISNYQSVKERFLHLANYKDSSDYVHRCEDAVAKLTEDEKKEEIYKSCQRVFSGNNPSSKDLEAAKIIFESLGDFKDSPDCAQKCADMIKAAAEEVERQQLLKKKKKDRRKRIGITTLIITVLAIAGFFLATKVIIPASQYKTAVKLYETGQSYEDFSDGYKTFEEALETFRSLPNGDKAAAFYTERAEIGDIPAMFYLGKIYDRGYFVEQDYQKAMEWYLKAAEAGNNYAMVNIGVMYHNGNGIKQDYQEAMEWYLRATETGNAIAMNNIGNLYFSGSGVKQDYQKALEWFSKAADAGYTNAMINIGQMYGTGTGVKQDDKKAMEWYLRAAEAGDTDAMCQVGALYANGVGVTLNYDIALDWFIKAADAGSAQAMRLVGAIYDIRDSDYKTALKWFKKAADAGDTEAMLFIAKYYFDAHGVTQDDSKALEWTIKAAEMGNTEAMFFVGKYYFQGTGTTSDYEEAAKWFERSAEAGNATAMSIIGQMYEEGIGVEKNDAKAKEWAANAEAAGYHG